MFKLIGKISVVFDRIDGALAYLVGVLIAFLMLSVSLDVFARNVFQTPLSWVMDACEYALLFIAFLSAAWVLKDHGHVRMDALVSKLNQKDATVLKFITDVIGAGMCLALAWYSARSTWTTHLEGVIFFKAYVVPKAPIMAVIPIGTFLLFVRFIKEAVGDLKILKQNTTDQGPTPLTDKDRI